MKSKSKNLLSLFQNEIDSEGFESLIKNNYKQCDDIAKALSKENTILSLELFKSAKSIYDKYIAKSEEYYSDLYNKAMKDHEKKTDKKLKKNEILPVDLKANSKLDSSARIGSNILTRFDRIYYSFVSNYDSLNVNPKAAEKLNDKNIKKLQKKVSKVINKYQKNKSRVGKINYEIVIRLSAGALIPIALLVYRILNTDFGGKEVYFDTLIILTLLWVPYGFWINRNRIINR